MPLTNFGAILNFAETLEQADAAFYTAAAAADPGAARETYRELAGEGEKNLSLVRRTRRENVTEMILEPIHDFTRDRYQIAVDTPTASALPAILASAIALEDRAIAYYGDAAEKIRALPEVSRALKTLAKKRRKRRERLAALSEK